MEDVTFAVKFSSDFNCTQ